MIKENVHLGETYLEVFMGKAPHVCNSFLNDSGKQIIVGVYIFIYLTLSTHSFIHQSIEIMVNVNLENLGKGHIGILCIILATFL